MQRTQNTVDKALTGLIERVRANRLILKDTAVRQSAAVAAARERRDEADRLVREVRRSCASLGENRSGFGPFLKAPPPILPRYSPAEPDPLDGVRQKLHEAYAATGDAAIRAELLSSYDGFARSLALRFRHRESLDDLFQVARIGLLHAIDRFDPALGRPFPLFARVTITGELKRHIRDRTWALRVPRSLQEDYLNVMRAVDELTAEHAASPSLDALAARCGI